MSALYWKKIGSAGVDSGTLMICDPCYVLQDPAVLRESFPTWTDFCAKQFPADGESVYDVRHGTAVVAPTAYGDGCYDVYGLFETGREKFGPLAMLVRTDNVTVPGLARSEYENNDDDDGEPED